MYGCSQGLSKYNSLKAAPTEVFSELKYERWIVSVSQVSNEHEEWKLTCGETPIAAMISDALYVLVLSVNLRRLGHS